ncbi:MAG: hypothetical protein ACK5Y2_04220 [Bdellovibrionales bacterium]
MARKIGIGILLLVLALPVLLFFSWKPFRNFTTFALWNLQLATPVPVQDAMAQMEETLITLYGRTPEPEVIQSLLTLKDELSRHAKYSVDLENRLNTTYETLTIKLPKRTLASEYESKFQQTWKGVEKLKIPITLDFVMGVGLRAQAVAEMKPSAEGLRKLADELRLYGSLKVNQGTTTAVHLSALTTDLKPRVLEIARQFLDSTEIQKERREAIVKWLDQAQTQLVWLEGIPVYQLSHPQHTTHSLFVTFADSQRLIWASNPELMLKLFENMGTATPPAEPSVSKSYPDDLTWAHVNLEKVISLLPPAWSLLMPAFMKSLKALELHLQLQKKMGLQAEIVFTRPQDAQESFKGLQSLMSLKRSREDLKKVETLFSEKGRFAVEGSKIVLGVTLTFDEIRTATLDEVKKTYLHVAEDLKRLSTVVSYMNHYKWQKLEMTYQHDSAFLFPRVGEPLKLKTGRRLTFKVRKPASKFKPFALVTQLSCEEKAQAQLRFKAGSEAQARKLFRLYEAPETANTEWNDLQSDKSVMVFMIPDSQDVEQTELIFQTPEDDDEGLTAGNPFQRSLKKDCEVIIEPFLLVSGPPSQ